MPGTAGLNERIISLTLDELFAWTRGTMDRYGLTDWKLVYVGGLPHALGSTNHGAQRIELSATHMFYADQAEQIDTALHEIAHALAGAHAQHGKIWKAMARAVGARDDAKTEQVIPTGAYPVQGHCPRGCSIGKSRMPKPGARCVRHREVVTFVRVPQAGVQPEIKRAVARYGAPKPNLHVGALVAVQVPGHAHLDQMRGRVIKIGRTRATVSIAGHPYIIAMENLKKVEYA